MRKCKTCGIPLWISWLIMAGFDKRLVKFKDGNDCVDFLGAKTIQKIKREVDEELNKVKIGG